MNHKQTVIVGLLLCGANHIIYPSMTISVNVTWMYEWSINTTDTFGDCCSIYIYIYIYEKFVYFGSTTVTPSLQHKIPTCDVTASWSKAFRNDSSRFCQELAWVSKPTAGTIIRDQCRNDVFCVRYETAAIYKALIASWSLWSQLSTKRW